MRFAVLAFIACAPLFAAGKPTLAEAVAAFGSDVADERDAASRAARRLLERELAPLLAAMESVDPEIKRRAREAIASFVPAHEEPVAQSEVDGNVIVLQAANLRGNLRVWVRGAGGRVVLRRDGQDDGTLTRFGIHGGPATDVLLRKQLRLARGRGYVVTKTDEDSAASQLGLQVHDIVLRVGDTPVQFARELTKALGQKQGWSDLVFHVLRDGEVKRLGRLP